MLRRMSTSNFRDSILQQHPVQAPTLIIVGEVVSLREKLAWYEQQGDLDT